DALLERHAAVVRAAEELGENWDLEDAGHGKQLVGVELDPIAGLQRVYVHAQRAIEGRRDRADALLKLSGHFRTPRTVVQNVTIVNRMSTPTVVHPHILPGRVLLCRPINSLSKGRPGRMRPAVMPMNSVISGSRFRARGS